LGDERTWEVSIVVDTASRQPTYRGVTADGLADAIAGTLSRIASDAYMHPHWKVGALLIQRTDQTLEARREHWDSEFYDRDRRGYRRRRFKVSAIERDWTAMIEADRKAIRLAQQAENASYKQRR
jgi:hypothetical protein